MDGTFYAYPKVFSQLYSIQGFVRGSILPLVFCLMEKMTQTSYQVIFEFINKKIKNILIE
jgi:hypothetical protein